MFPRFNRRRGMPRLVLFMGVLALGLALGCGEQRSQSLASTRQTLSGLSATITNTGIFDITWNGTNLTAGVGAYYIIGSCTGADDSNNVTSAGSDGKTLLAPGNCPGAPFSLSAVGTNPITVTITIGPLPADYNTLSVPLDPNPEYFDHFAFDGSFWYGGCANTWTQYSGSGAPFSAIPQPCVIPNVGNVGVAEVRPPGSWGEISGSLVTIRRTVLSETGLTTIGFVRHPGTNNIELGFSKLPVDNPIPKNSIVKLTEQIWLYDASSAPGDDAALVSASVPAYGKPGSLLPIAIETKNTGTNTWLEPANHLGGTRLGALGSNQLDWKWGASGGYAFGPTDQRIYLSGPVGPGENAKFTFDAVLPTQTGNYVFSAQMVHDGVSWFGEKIEKTVIVDQNPPRGNGGTSGNGAGGIAGASGSGAGGAYGTGGASGSGATSSGGGAGGDMASGGETANGDAAIANPHEPSNDGCSIREPVERSRDGSELVTALIVALALRGRRLRRRRLRPRRSAD